jgi:FlaA1/EpsC-like NDP-sugar epimerase
MKYGSAVHGIRVLGTMADVGSIARRYKAEQAIVSIADAPGPVIRDISDACRRAGLTVKVVPGLYQIVGGRINLTSLRDVAIEDLLRRDAVVLDAESVARDLRGRTAVVTGAGGSIGSELCRQICSFAPRRLILIERSENALFEVHRELCGAHPELDIVPCIADIGDKARIEEIFSDSKPEIVFHAAAHKHVPMMEWNPFEAAKNNVFGTVRLADAARAHGVRAFVMISTDKAVNPTSVMGASKRCAEIYVQAMAEAGTTRFVTVRFGNVLGSTGSVVPIFRQQIAQGGPVTVTHPEMKRYFMTIPEACQLVLQAGAMGAGGEIFILDMGEPVKIVDLARDLIQLSGLGAEDIPIVFSGIRPGEKLYEELSIAAESAEKTRHPKVFVGTTTAESLALTRTKLQRLESAIESGDRERLFAALAELVPEYRRDVQATTPATVAPPLPVVAGWTPITEPS